MTHLDNQQRQLQGLALLLQLQRKARGSEDLAALGFTIVNETRSLLNYRQAALWVASPFSKIVALSGVAQFEAHAPYVVWLRRLAEHRHQHVTLTTAQPLRADELPADLARDWADWCAPYGLWLTLRTYKGGNGFGGLLLFRDTPWQEGEVTLLSELTEAYAHAWQALQPHRGWWRTMVALHGKRRWWLALPLLFLLPVRLSVLAPAEIVAIDPTVVRAPLDGVVGEFFVHPNQAVIPDQPLLTLENTDIANRLDVARKALAVAEADYRSNAQQALVDGKAKSELNVLKSKIDQHSAEVNYLADQLERSHVNAPHAGIAIFTDVQDWLGKPVSIGERLLLVADPQRVQLQMHLPVADLIGLEDGAETVMFLNSDPQHPLDAKLYSIAYQAEVTADNVLAYRLKAHLESQQILPRIGLKGTAKIYGQRVTLFYYLFRRPLAGLRQWSGL